MAKTSKSAIWVAAVAAAAGACVINALVSSAPTSTTDANKVPPPLFLDSAIAASAARVSATAEGNRRVEAWRQSIRLAGSPQRLRAFVDELIGLKQKFHLAFEAFQGPRYPQRVLDLFRRRIIDERQLAADLEATVAAYDQLLFEQDRRFYEPAGIPREQWIVKVHGGRRTVTSWDRFLVPVVERAISEARRDGVRFAGGQLAADIAGNRIKKMARDAGWDTSEEGSLRDHLSGFIVDVGAGIAIDEATDATDTIVSRLSDEMARAERELLDGEGGLRQVLRQTAARHEAARISLKNNPQTP